MVELYIVKKEKTLGEICQESCGDNEDCYTQCLIGDSTESLSRIDDNGDKNTDKGKDKESNAYTEDDACYIVCKGKEEQSFGQCYTDCLKNPVEMTLPKTKKSDEYIKEGNKIKCDNCTVYGKLQYPNDTKKQDEWLLECIEICEK